MQQRIKGKEELFYDLIEFIIIKYAKFQSQKKKFDSIVNDLQTASD